MPMNKSQWSKELKKTFNGKAILFSEDLAKLIGTNHHVVKCLRSGMSIPLPTVKDGRRWGIKLADVAEWMTSRTPTAASLPLADNRLRAPARQRASLGRSLLELKRQSEAIKAYQEYLDELINEVSLLEHLAISRLEDVLADELRFNRPRPRATLPSTRTQE